MEHFGEQHGRTFTLFSMRSFYWISNLVGEALKSDFLFLILEQNSAQASTLGEYFPRFRPMDPPTNDARRYEAKEASPLGELSSEADVFPGSGSVAPPPCEVACILSSLSSLNLLDQNWQRFVSVHKFQLGAK